MVTELYPAVYLDRDGVINRPIIRDGKPYPPRTMSEFEIMPGVASALERLKSAGFINVVVTNQPDIATKRTTLEFVDSIHNIMRATLAIDSIFVCYCLEGPSCDCYKPKPGLLNKAAKELKIDQKRSFMVGDRWRDVGAGKSVGCTTLFIDYGYEETMPYPPDYVVRDLPDAADLILSKIGPK